MRARPARAGGDGARLVVATLTGRMSGVDPATGDPAWTLDIARDMSPWWAHGRVIAWDRRQRLTIVDPETGNAMPVRAEGGTSVRHEAPLGVMRERPVVVGQRVTIHLETGLAVPREPVVSLGVCDGDHLSASLGPLRDKGLAVVALEDGELVWQRVGDRSVPVAIGDGMVFSWGDGRLKGWDLVDGSPRFERPVGWPGPLGPLLVAGLDGCIVLPEPEAVPPSLVAIDPTSGAPRWAVETCPLGAPVADPGLVYCAEQADHGGAALVARAIDDGTEQWREPLPANSTVSAAVAGLVLVQTPGQLVAYGP